MKTRDRPKAVLFDLFNTLVPGGSREERDDVSRRMAATLGVAPASFAALVRETFDDRTRGRLGDLRRTTAHLARELGAAPAAESVDAAVEMRLDMTRTLHAQSWALPALTELGRAGVLRGLVSDCSAETPTIWAESPLSPLLEAVSFSCVTGHRKPEPEAYLYAVDSLAVDVAECIFVGDGGSRELTGAAALGMRAIRFVAPDGSRGEPIDEDDEWPGESVDDLMDVVRLFA